MDVLDSTTPRRPRVSARVALGLAGAAVALTLIVPDLRQDGLDLLEPASSPGPSRTLSLVLAPGAAVVGRTRGPLWDGGLVLDLDGGAALLQVSAAAQEAVGPAVGHSWGTLHARIGHRHCTGSFGWRSSWGGPYGGGRIDLACDDGSRPTGALRTYDRLPVEDAAWSGILDLAPG